MALWCGKQSVNAFVIDFGNYILNYLAEKQTSRVPNYKEVRCPLLFGRMKLTLAPWACPWSKLLLLMSLSMSALIFQTLPPVKTLPNSAGADQTSL